MTEARIEHAASPLEHDRRQPSALGPGSQHHCEGANRNRDQLVSIWLLTLTLFIFFLGCSFVVALLATHFEWLGSATAPLNNGMRPSRDIVVLAVGQVLTSAVTSLLTFEAAACRLRVLVVRKRFEGARRLAGGGNVSWPPAGTNRTSAVNALIAAMSAATNLLLAIRAANLASMRFRAYEITSASS
jgi:hypothetical protein